ncbi:MAG: hypothetical protein MJZ41_00870 [Bacteroidaceae bacterium]|nr:hypothetical protein [Bacteroidaceae bacterium]
MENVPFDDIAKAPKGESSTVIRQRVLMARKAQDERCRCLVTHVSLVGK